MVKSRDPKTMADGIIRLLKDESLRRTYEARSLTRATEKFSLSAMAGEYRELYQRIAEGPSSKSMAVPEARVEA